MSPRNVDLHHPARPWVPPQSPRVLAHGMPGGIFNLDLPDGQWVAVLRLESSCPDQPSSSENDHFRTVYVQVPPGPLVATRDEVAIPLGVLFRVKFGVGNPQMRTFVDVVPNGIAHIPLTAESVIVEAATVPTFLTTSPAIDLDKPTPLRADVPPAILIGILQDQALSANEANQTKRMVNTIAPAIGIQTILVPMGAQNVEVIAPAGVIAQQIDSNDNAFTIPLNQIVPLLAGVTELELHAGINTAVGVVFSLGI